MEDWLSAQTESMAGDWERAVEQFYPEHAATWRDPAAQLRALLEEWNTLDAARKVDWSTLVPGPSAEVLDLGAGTGWLSALLSTFPQIRRIDALDSSRHNLGVMLPAIVTALKGDPAKVRPVRGLFTPLRVPDGHYDAIVASSAVHHAPSLAAVLRECRRALKPGGVLAILNEVPLNRGQYVFRAGKIFAAACWAALTGRYVEYSPSLSKSGILYDPYLGDRSYTFSQWRSALSEAGYSFETRVMPFGSYKRGGSDRLVHFIARPTGGPA